MIDGPIHVLTVAAAVGSGVVAGVFFAFSTFVMRALGRLPAPQGIAAMQAINVAAPTPWFMVALFGTVPVCVALSVWAGISSAEPGAAHLLVASGLYLVAPALTIGYHVPQNNALAAVDPSHGDGARLWARYLKNWTAWNHVRTLAPMVAAAVFVLATRAG